MPRCSQNSRRFSPLVSYSSSTRRISADRSVSFPMPLSSAIYATRSRWVPLTLTIDKRHGETKSAGKLVRLRGVGSQENLPVAIEYLACLLQKGWIIVDYENHGEFMVATRPRVRFGSFLCG